VQRRQIDHGDAVFAGDEQFAVAADQQHAPQDGAYGIDNM
jgi:hypothetical protein